MRYDVCIFAPLAWERAAVAAALPGLTATGPRRWETTSAAAGSCLLLQTGVGPGRAAASAAAAPAAGCMIVCGCAGALVSHLGPGTVVLADAAHDAATGERFATVALPLVDWAGRFGVEAVMGPIVTTSVPLGSEAAKRQGGACGALAVDMESAAIARVAATRGIPVVVLRVILDAVGDGLPPLGLVDEASGRVRIGAALRYFLPPSRWPLAARLGNRRRAADRGLRRATALLLGHPGRSALGAIRHAIDYVD